MYIRQGLSIHKMIGTSCKYIYRYKYLILDVLMWFCVGKHVKFTCIHINQNQTQQKSQSIILMRCEEFKPLQTQNGNGWQWLPICMNDDPISCHIFQIDKRWSQAQRPSHHWSILRDMQEAQKVLHNFEDFRVSPFNKLHRTSAEACMWFATMVIIKKTIPPRLHPFKLTYDVAMCFCWMYLVTLLMFSTKSLTVVCSSYFFSTKKCLAAQKRSRIQRVFTDRFHGKEHCSSPRWSKFPWRSSPSSSQRMGQHRSLYGTKWGLDASSGHRLSRPPGMKNPVKTLNFRFLEKMSTWKISGPVYY